MWKGFNLTCVGLTIWVRVSFHCQKQTIILRVFLHTIRAYGRAKHARTKVDKKDGCHNEAYRLILFLFDKQSKQSKPFFECEY